MKKGSTAPNLHERRRLAASEAAAYIGVSLKTLQNWRFIGGGPPYLKINSRKTVYDTATSTSGSTSAGSRRPPTRPRGKVEGRP